MKPYYQRFAPYASEGLVPAKAVLVGSRHTAESLWAAMPLEGLRERTFLGPPGVDIHTFVPRGPTTPPRSFAASCAGWRRRADRLQRRRRGGIDDLCDPRRDQPPSGEELAEVRKLYDIRGIDAYAPHDLAEIDPRVHPIVCFVGKLIVSKGIDLLIAAWPLVLMKEPRARLVLVGFGTYREGVEILIRGLERADERLLMHVCRYGRELEGGPRDQLTYLRTFLEGLAGRHERYFAAAKKMRETIVFTGGSSTASSRGCCPRSTRWSCPACSRRRSGWWRRRPRPAARCRSAPRTRAWPRSQASSASACPRRAGAAHVRAGMRAVEDLGVRDERVAAAGRAAALVARAALARPAEEHFGWESVAESVLAASKGAHAARAGARHGAVRAHGPGLIRRPARIRG